MRRFLLLIMTIITVRMINGTAMADQNSPLPDNYFSQNTENSGSTDFSFNDSDETSNKQKLAIPRDTPTPLEEIRWRKKTVLIYMRTTDPQLKTAFRNAVKKWNQVKAVKIKWTKDEEKANIIATDSDLSSNATNNGGGYQITQLGETKTEYNPDTHELHRATSILDPYQLDYTNANFRTEVAEHELGHALGLAHAPEYEHSVMVPRNIRTGITKNDRQTLKMLYQ